jgi:uncharacterized coiled-coil DUF342 family protein
MSDQAITSIDQFAQALAAADEPQDEPAAQPDEPEAAEGEPAEPAEAVEGDTDEPVEEVEGDQPEEPESLDDKVVAWKTASGDEFEVPVAELKNGYMREQDYRHKTQNLASEREQAAAHIQEQFQHVQAYKQDLGMVTAIDIQIQAIKDALSQSNVDDDPVGYLKATAQLQQLSEHRTGLANRMAQLEQQQQAQSQSQLAQKQQAMLAELQSLPNFGNELLTKLTTLGQELGYTADELSKTTDARFVRLLNEVSEYRALKAKAPAAVNKVKAAPIKPTKQAASAPQSAVEQHAKRFAQKKDKNTFAALYAQTL